jgi:hypothetical protein
LTFIRTDAQRLSREVVSESRGDDMLTKINGEVLGVADACKRVMELAASKMPFKIEPIYNSAQKVQACRAQFTEVDGQGKTIASGHIPASRRSPRIRS